MSVDERHRLALHEAARQTWGPEVAVTLMEMLPAAGWAEVATRSDVDHLSTVLRGEMAQLGSELRVEIADFRTTVERSLRMSLMWTITTMVAGFSGIAAVTAIAH